MKNKRLKISLVTVCFNSGATIRDTIESVLCQDYLYVEHIVIDGGSTDNTLDILASYADRISLVITEPDRGMYDAMNKGVQKCTGDVIGILNSDDVLYSHVTLSKISETFSLDNNIDAVFSAVGYANTGKMGVKPSRLVKTQRFRPWMLRFGWMPPHPGMFLKRLAYVESGGYKLTFNIAADYEFMVRILLKNGISYKTVNFTSVSMRLGGISTQGLRSIHIISKEIVRSCLENNVYSNYILVSFRLPFKYVKEVIFQKCALK